MRERQRVGATAAFGIVAGALALLLLCSALLIGSAAHSLIKIPGPLLIPTVQDLPTATATHPPATATATTAPCRAAYAQAGLLAQIAHKPAPTRTPTPPATATTTPTPSPSPTPTHSPTPTMPPAPCGA